MVFPTNAIQTCLTMKVLFGMALRQTTGFVESLLRLIDLAWVVPKLTRRAAARRPEGEHPQSLVPAPAPPADRHRAGKRHRFERPGEGDQGRGRVE